MLRMFGETNVVRLVPEKEDEIKLRYMTSIMTTSRTSGKFTYLNCVRLFDKGDCNRSGYMVEAFLAY